MRGRRGALAVSGQADLAELISQRPAQIAILRRPPIQRSEEDVDMLLSLCEGMRWMQNEVKRHDDRRALVRMLRYTYYGPDRVVVHEGARGNDMFLVLSGRLRAKTISREQVGGTTDETEIVLAELGPNDHFGELALINPLGTRAATVVTMEATELLRIDRTDFQQVTKVGSKAARMQASDVAAKGNGEEWRARLRALHAAAFEGDALGLQRALMPEAEAAVFAVRERRRLEGFQKQLRAKREQQPLLAGRLTIMLGGVDEVVKETARVAKKEEQVRRVLARAEHKLHVQGATLTESEEKVMLKNVEELRARLRELKWSQRDNQVELANARQIAESAKSALAGVDESQKILERKIDECRTAIVQANAVERLIDVRDTQGRTAAFLAAESGHHGLLVLLLRHGAELHIPDHQGVSPLHIACRRGHANVVRYLLGLDVRRLQEVEDNNAETPIYTACFEGYVEIVKMILESSSCDVNKPTSAGTTPVFACVDRGNLVCLKLIAEHGARGKRSVDYSRARSLDEATPFYIACRHGDVSCVKYLSEHAPVSTRETPACDGTTPFAIAACQGHLAVIKYLAQSGVNPEAQNHAGNAPLHLAAAEGHLEVVQYLVDDLHVPLFISNASGVDPFQAAADASNVGAKEVVGWLAARPIPPAEAMKRTRLLQRRLRKPNDVTNPLRRPASEAEEKADIEDEEKWVAEEEASTARVAKAQLVNAALQEPGGIWSMLSNAVANLDGQKDGQTSEAHLPGSSGLDIVALIGQVQPTGKDTMNGPTDDEIAAELRAIEWNNIANGTTISEGGVTTAVRGKQLSVNSVYRRLLKVRPEWGKGVVPDLKERVRALNESTRAAAGKRWLRYLAKDARNPKEPWAWVAPSAGFGEVLSAAAGMAVPGPGTELAKLERPAGAISDWADAVALGSEKEMQATASNRAREETQRPQGRDAIARSAMAAAEAHWASMHPEEAEKEKQERHGVSAATGRRRGGQNGSTNKPMRAWATAEKGPSMSIIGETSGGGGGKRGVAFANSSTAESTSRLSSSSVAAATSTLEKGDDVTNEGKQAWGRLRGRRNAVLAADFAKSWTGGNNDRAKGVAKPETVGERALIQRRKEAADQSDSEDGDNHHYESRVAFMNRVHRERVASGDQTMGLGRVATAMAHRQEARQAKLPEAVAARRRASILDVARQRKRLMRQ